MTVTKLVEVEKEQELDFLMAVVASAIGSTLERAMKVHAQLGLIGLAGVIVLLPVMMDFKHVLVNVKTAKWVIVRDLLQTKSFAVNRFVNANSRTGPGTTLILQVKQRLEIINTTTLEAAYHITTTTYFQKFFPITHFLNP